MSHGWTPGGRALFFINHAQPSHNNSRGGITGHFHGATCVEAQDLHLRTGVGCAPDKTTRNRLLRRIGIQYPALRNGDASPPPTRAVYYLRVIPLPVLPYLVSSLLAPPPPLSIARSSDATRLFPLLCSTRGAQAAKEKK
jgi:hypothetical protein